MARILLWLAGVADAGHAMREIEEARERRQAERVVRRQVRVQIDQAGDDEGPLEVAKRPGVVRLGESELSNPLRNDYLGAYLYTLQRITGVIAFFFIGWHVYTTRYQYYFADAHIDYAMMSGIMSNPVSFAIFLIGTAASVFHFTNGIWTFAITWGLTIGRRAQRTLRAASLGAFVLMYAMCIAILMAFRA